jgi:hypothetical protein
VTQPPPLETDTNGSVEVPAEATSARRHVRARWIAAAVVAALLASGGFGLWRSVTADADGDGLTDRVEASGWETQDGSVHRTNPDRADTDGDGLTDSDEAGALASTDGAPDVHVGYADPLRADTDSDDLPDGDEADLGLDPQDRDSDDDTLRDGYEIDVAGTAPDIADTDGDGFNDGYEDANRETHGLDPLVFDVETSKWTYVTDFATGFVFGDLRPGDSLAWLAGNLAATGIGSLPGPGQVVGTVTQTRDAVGKAIEGDWVGSGFSAMGILPGQNASAIPKKVEQFLARNPRIAALAASIIAKANAVPTVVKRTTARVIWAGWQQLVSAGASEDELIELQRGTTNLNGLAERLSRPGHVHGDPVSPADNGKVGESTLATLYGAQTAGVDRQVRVSTAGCVVGCHGTIRMVDVLVNGIAHESKVGRTALSPAIEGQIRKDAWLVQTGQLRGAHWHFFASSSSHTLGATDAVYELLDALRIPYTIHLPV